jgi:cyclophilin family peptidyl-prolyl cis-trans isomerase
MARFGLFVLCLVLLLIAPAQAQDRNPIVVIDTSLGKIRVELDPKAAPVTVKNFLDYVDAKFYDGTLFHRVMPDFMIQGGGLEPGLKEKRTKDPIKNESGNGLSNVRGAIAMARLPKPDTATAQFFINVVDNKRLDELRYAVFGRVIGGIDVVDKIRQVETTGVPEKMMKNVPVKDVIIRSIRREMK